MLGIPNFDQVVELQKKLADELEKLNMWMAMLNGFPAQTDPRKLPHDKMKIKYAEVIHPSSIAELIHALNNCSNKNK